MAGGVLVATLSAGGGVDGPGGGMAAGWSTRRADRVVPGRVVAHVLQVGRPAESGGGHLVAGRLDSRRVDAPFAEDLTIRPGYGIAGEGDPARAVALRTQSRGLPGDLGDVVDRAVVPYRVVVLQQRPHPGERPGQVRIGRRGSEALLVALLLQLDDPHVP